MSDLIRRAEQSLEMAADLSLPAWQRLENALESLSGLELSRLLPSVREPLERGLLRINGLMRQSDSMEALTDADAESGLTTLQQTLSLAIENELERITRELAQKGRLPEAAIQEARQHRTRMIPHLIQEIREAAAAVSRGDDPPSGNAYFLGLFLLTEWKATEAWDAILEAVSLPDELPENLFGDAVTESLPQVFAALATDRAETLERLLMDPRVYHFVRWQAVYVPRMWVRDDRWTPEEATEWLLRALRSFLREENEEFVTAVAYELTAVNPLASRQEIRLAFELDLIDPGLFDCDYFERRVQEYEADPRVDTRRLFSSGFEDVIAELRTWAVYSEERRSPPVVKPIRPLPGTPNQPSHDQRSRAVGTAMRPGRNETCPCGSGKKYKKCCGSRH